MASPQTENGFTKIANEILEAVQMYKLTLNEMKVIMCVWRFTFGFNRKSHTMSLSFFENYTGLSRTRINTSLKNLIEANVIERVEVGDAKRTNSYQFNKYYNTWKVEKYAVFNSVQDVTDTSVRNDTGNSVQNDTDTSIQDVTITSVQDDTVTSVQNVTDTSVRNATQERKVKESIKENVKKVVERKGDHLKNPKTAYQENTATTTPMNFDFGYGEVIRIFEENICMLSPIQKESLGHWFDDLNQDKEIIVHAIKIAADRNRKNYGFVEYLLREWVNNKLTTLEQIESHERNQLDKRRQSYGHTNQQRDAIVPSWYEQQQRDQRKNTVPNNNTADLEERRRKLRESLAQPNAR